MSAVSAALHNDSSPEEISPLSIPTFADIQDAADRLQPYIVRTPLLSSAVLDAHAQSHVLIKAEPLQRTGSFKFRGALNRILCLSETEKRAGVVAWSSGNHAQGIAAAAGLFNIPAVIVMPKDAPTLKIENTRSLGAEVVLYDRAHEDREQISYDIAKARGLVVVPSFDDPHIIAGQGTVGLEAMAQATEMGFRVDHIIAPVSGGGLIGGIGLAARASNPHVQIYAAEPEHYDDHRRSLLAGTRISNTSKSNALCDALLANTPGKLTWSINAKQLQAGYAVSDAQVCTAMAFAARHLKVVVEPGGAVALAAVLAGLHRKPDHTTVVVLSGGNVDAGLYRMCLEDGGRSAL